MKHILISGVSTGIGYETLRYFISQNYCVYGSVRKTSDAKRLTAEFPKNFICLQFDVTNPEGIQQAKAVVEKAIGDEPLCALVNNAGFAQGGPVALMSDATFRQQMEVNLFGMRNVTNAFLPFLGATKTFSGKPGKIINISSISGIINTPMNGAYCVAKHAMESLGEVYRRELMMYGIQVVSIQPGPIQSKLWHKSADSMDEYLNTDYKNFALNAKRIMRNARKEALPAKIISSLIHHIIESKRPKLSYLVARNKWLNIFVAQYLPTRIVDYFLYRSLSR